MSNIPWFAWFPILGIVGWILITLAGTLSGSRRRDAEAMKTALAESAGTNRQLAERLDQMDKRLAGIEKTLNDIP